MPKSKCNQRIETPCLVADISDGYIQSKACANYIGVIRSEVVENGTNKVIILSNPKNSGVNIYINIVVVSNFSRVPARYLVVDFPIIEGNLTVSKDVAPSNLECNGCQPQGQLMSGMEVDVYGGQCVADQVIPPFNNLIKQLSGSIILSPGTERVYILEAINCEDSVELSFQVIWWEQRREHECHEQ